MSGPTSTRPATSRPLAAAYTGFAWGYACSFAEAWLTGDPDPFAAAERGGAIGFGIGLAAGIIAPSGAGIYGGVVAAFFAGFGLGSSPTTTALVVRVGCAALAFGSTSTGRSAIRKFLADESGSIGPQGARAAQPPLPEPVVSDKGLANRVRDLYKGTKGPNPIGSGTTADAVRNELRTGLPTHGTFHSDKAQQYVRGLTNWMRNNPNASSHDRVVAQSLLDDLKSALSGN